MPQCECLNEAKEHTLHHCLKQGLRDQSTLYLQSDCDEELLISLQFMSPVRIASIKIEGPADQAPSAMRLFVNKIGLDFDSAKTEAPTQELKLSEADVEEGGKAVELRYVLFQNVQRLTLFIPGNFGGGDETVITKLVLLGTPIVHEGLKRSKDEQDKATKGDWLGSGGVA